MPRYGDLDKLKERMLNYYECVNSETCKSNYRGETLMAYEVADLIEDCIDNAPTADVEPVVHCEKCLHSEANNTGYWCKKACYIADAMVTPQHFCSYGERRNDG